MLRKTFSQPTLRLLFPTYTPHNNSLSHVHWPSTEAAANTPSNPRHHLSNRRLAATDPASLIWSVKLSKRHFARAALRNWLKRRVRVAFVQALREHHDSQIAGVLSIRSSKDLAAASFEDILDQCRSMILGLSAGKYSHCTDALQTAG